MVYVTEELNYQEQKFVDLHYTNDYYYDVQLTINHVISKTMLHLMAICITSHKHSKHMLKVCRKFSKSFQHLNFFSYFLWLK